MIDADLRFMRMALDLAQQGEAEGEVPVGAVIVLENEVVGSAFNTPISLNDPTAHAEILAIRQAAAHLRNYRLTGTVIYTTLEPCAMCAGAIVHSRISRLVFGARDLRFGAIRSKFQLADSDLLNHKVEIEEGICGAECTELLKQFFKNRR